MLARPANKLVDGEVVAKTWRPENEGNVYDVEITRRIARLRQAGAKAADANPGRQNRPTPLPDEQLDQEQKVALMRVAVSKARTPIQAGLQV